MSGDRVSSSPDAPVSPSDSTTTHLSRHWLQVEAIFHQALDLPENGRAARVAEWCGEDTHLRNSVMQMLSADSSVEQLMAASPEPVADEFLRRVGDRADDAGPEEKSSDPWIGRTLGAFRLESLLGRGGMGVVYRAERTSGGFSQTVALKLLDQHLHSSPAIALFLEERQALAQLEHPNIARLLDGGVTDEGFPYLVMEYIDGRRLDQACDDPAATGDQVLRWFLQLCDAVTYVHRNLILHRDLKPGNVMVGNDGTVKLLDFGALKHIGPNSNASSAMTQAGLRPVTVRYSSPEHIQGATVSTATDVYSLGMILYRLIAGRHPFEGGDISLGGYLDRLRAQSFMPSSQAALESTGPGRTQRFSGGMARDLDAIAAKAIRCEPEDRYQTVSALAEEIWSVLLHRPVQARRGSFSYRAVKFYRRHRLAVLMAAAAVLVTAAGVAAMQWQAHEAKLQQERADRGVEEERKLVHLLLSDYFDQLSLVPGSIDAQRKAVTLSLRYLDNLAEIAPGSSLELDRIKGYTDMGMLLGNSYEQNLGDVPGGIQALNKAVAIASKQLQATPHDAIAMHAYIQAEYGLGSTYLGEGDAKQAEQYLLTALKPAADLALRPDAGVDALHQAASVSDTLGDVYDPGRGYATADTEKALRTYLLSNSFDDRCRVRYPNNEDCWSNTVVGDYKIGSLIEDTDPELAAKQYRDGLAVVRGFSPELAKTTHSRRLRDYMLARLGLMNLRMGNRRKGDDLVHDALEGFRLSIHQAELDNRARFDLVAFETDLAAEYDRLNRERDASEASDEVLATLAILLARSPNNRRWQMIQAENMITGARVKARLGQKLKSSRLRQQGLSRAVQLAEAKDASPEALGFAADDLVELLPYSGRRQEDALMAVEFAQRAVIAFARPAPGRYLTLAKAQAAAGHAREASQTARLVLNGLSGPVKSNIVAGEIADAKSLIGSR